jgi:hypothetical protein
MKHIILADYVSWDDTKKVSDMLDRYKNIDLVYDDGIYFKLSIKHDNIKILNFLLQYYEQTNLKGDFNSIEYKVAKHKLQQILQDAVNTFTPSKEIQEVLEKYLPKEEDINSEQDLSDLENLLGFDTKEIQHSIEEDTTNINVDLSGDNIQKVH